MEDEKENELKDELKLLAMPLIKFLKENYNPYCKVEVSEKGVNSWRCLLNTN